MAHPLFEPPMIAWGRAGARVQVAFTSTRDYTGARRWSLRLSHGAEQYDVPLGFSTPPGLDPLRQTHAAVLCCAGRMLAELGAVPTDAAGQPIANDAAPHRPASQSAAPAEPARTLTFPTDAATVRVVRRGLPDEPVRSFPLLGARASTSEGLG